MKKILLFVPLFFASLIVRSQSISPDVISSSGSFFSNSNYSVAWSLGEVMGETYSTANNAITQGFHQPDYGTLTFVEDPTSETQIIAFPNPVIHDLNISFADKKGTYIVKIIDAIGNQLASQTVSVNGSAVKKVYFTNYPSGIYLIQIINSQSFSKSSYTIIKVGM